MANETKTLPLPVAAPKSRIATRRHRDDQIRRAIRKARRLAPHLDNPLFLPLLQNFCRVSLLLERSYNTLRNADILDAEGNVKPAAEFCRRLTETQSRLAAQLGLTPSTLRALMKDNIVDLASAMVEDSNDNGE